MATIHMVLQGKGGVGKSMLAAMLAQFKISNGQTPVCIDTDPVNATFYGFKSLNVQRLDVLDDDKNVDASKFDDLIEIISETNYDVIIDNGASSFIPLSTYLVANDIASVFQEMGHQLFVHTVITGGQAMPDTLAGFDALVRQFPNECVFVVWLNPYWGKVENKGVDFEEMSIYKNNADRIIQLVEVPILTAETFGRDFSDMLKKRHTFDEAIHDGSLKIMQRQRLKIIQSKIFDELGKGGALLYGY